MTIDYVDRNVILLLEKRIYLLLVREKSGMKDNYVFLKLYVRVIPYSSQNIRYEICLTVLRKCLVPRMTVKGGK